MLRSVLRTLTVALAACAAGVVIAASAAVAPQAAEQAHIDVARSALLSVEATESADTVTFWIRRVADKKLVDGKDLVVSFGGRNQVFTRHTDGSYTVSADDLRGKDPKAVQIIVGHDGIREILEGQLPPPPEKISVNGLLGGHGQLAWWIINIGVVLIGVIALSRKKSY
jgi:hypothetical protein